MATIDDLIDDLQAWTSVGSTRLPDAVGQECVNTAMRRLQRIHPWLRSKTTRLTVGTTDGAVPLPPDFVTEHTVSAVDEGQSDPSKALIPISRTTRAQWLAAIEQDVSVRDQVYPQTARPGATEGQAYYLYDDQLVLVPTPSSETVLQLDYEPSSMDLTAGTATENLLTKSYPDIVRHGALAEAYHYLHEPERALLHDQRFGVLAKEGISQREAGTYAGTKPIHRGL